MIIIFNLFSTHQPLEKYSFNASSSSQPFDIECLQKQWDNVFISEYN